MMKPAGFALQNNNLQVDPPFIFSAINQTLTSHWFLVFWVRVSGTVFFILSRCSRHGFFLFTHHDSMAAVSFY